MKILHLPQYEDRFLNYCNEFKSGNRKTDWFNKNLSHSIINRYKKYPHWSFLVNDAHNLIAFSCVQTHFFPDNCARVLTRTFYHPNHRRKSLRYESDTKTPAMYMLEDQITWIEKNLSVDHLFFSVEYINRKQSLIKLAQKLNNIYNSKWKVLDDLYQTYPSDDKNSWQSVCVLNATEKNFPLKSITIDNWKNKYEQ